MLSLLSIMLNVPDIMFASDDVTVTVPDPDSPLFELQLASNSEYWTLTPEYVPAAEAGRSMTRAAEFGLIELDASSPHKPGAVYRTSVKPPDWPKLAASAVANGLPSRVPLTDPDPVAEPPARPLDELHAPSTPRLATIRNTLIGFTSGREETNKSSGGSRAWPRLRASGTADDLFGRLMVRGVHGNHGLRRRDPVS
jgi:hypothetical protein